MILIQTTTTAPLSSTSYYSDGGQYYVTFVTSTKGCEIDQDREKDVAEATEVLLGRRKNIFEMFIYFKYGIRSELTL